MKCKGLPHPGAARVYMVGHIACGWRRSACASWRFSCRWRCSAICRRPSACRREVITHPSRPSTSPSFLSANPLCRSACRRETVACGLRRGTCGSYRGTFRLRTPGYTLPVVFGGNSSRMRTCSWIQFILRKRPTLR